MAFFKILSSIGSSSCCWLLLVFSLAVVFCLLSFSALFAELASVFMLVVSIASLKELLEINRFEISGTKLLLRVKLW